MKPYEELDRANRISRMRQLALAALNAYGLSGARFRFLKQAGNTLFRVNERTPPNRTREEIYERGQYLLRIHQPGYQTSEAIDLELQWLAAMCRDAHLPVPEPVPSRDGSLLTQASIPGIPGVFNVSLLRWVKGRQLRKEEFRPHHYRAQGILSAQLHQYAEHWRPPAGLVKRNYDWDGLFSEDGGAGIPAREAWSLLPTNYLAPFRIVTDKVRQVMNELGKGPDVYGLIHADLGLDANVLFWKGEAHAIDFDDSGTGYYLYDLSLALEHCQEDRELPRLRDSLLEGYTQFRSLPADTIEYMSIFLAGFCVFLSLWAAASMPSMPDHRKELHQRMERALRLVKRLI